MDKTLLIIRGLPGEGKSTLGTLIHGLDPINVRHYEADMFHMKDGTYQWKQENVHAAHQWCQRETLLAMLDEVPLIIVSNTFTTNKEMQPYVKMAKDNHYRYIVIEMATRDAWTWEALANVNEHNVPMEVIQKMDYRWEVFKD